MESPISSSFIPHDTSKAAERALRPSSGGLSELLLLLSIVLFVASAALGVGVFLYKQYLTTASASKLHQLELAKAAFEPSLIVQLTKLDDRMHAGDMVLGLHMSPTAFFKALEQATLQTVSFASLTFSASDPQRITISMQGIGHSVNSIALQAEVFSKNGVITNPLFSGIARSRDGVHFNFRALVNPASINFVQNLNAATAQTTQTDTQNGSLPSPQGFQGPSVSNQGNQQQAPPAAK